MANDLWCREYITERSKGFEDKSAYSNKEEEMCTSLYQLLYCWNRRGGQNIDCSSHCQIKNVSKQKPFVFCFLVFLYNFLSVLKQTSLFFFCSYMKTTFIKKKPVVLNLLPL